MSMKMFGRLWRASFWQDSWLLKLLLLFVFFLPLRGVQIPIAVFGFEINPARLAAAGMTALLLLVLAMDSRVLKKFTARTGVRNPFVWYLFVYFLLSIAYYYLLVFAGETILFGADEPAFFRNWKGRPFAQLLAWVTYGLVPFLLIQSFAESKLTRRRLEKAFTAAFFLLLLFAGVQVLWYLFARSPLIGRNILEFGKDLGFVTVLGVPLYRANSLAGEPRDFGTFLVGAIPFYLATRFPKPARRQWGIAAVAGAFFLLTTSNSAFLAAAAAGVLIGADAFARQRLHIRHKHLKAAVVLALLLVLVVSSTLDDVIFQRLKITGSVIIAQLRLGVVQPLAQEQTSNVVLLYYAASLPEQPPHLVLFGGGYSNFITPVSGLITRYFDRTVEQSGIPTTDTFAGKLLVEGGIVGMTIYLLMFLYMLILNSKLIAALRVSGDAPGQRKARWLGYSFIGFFAANSVQFSYFYFILMGLMLGWLNAELRQVTTSPRSAPPLQPSPV